METLNLPPQASLAGQPSAHNFQVNLDGIINLLSNHLYSAPVVYIREVLQNATDAITARRQLEPGLEGRISLQALGGEQPCLVIEDNGIGLTEEEVFQFLANIGASTKRDARGGKEGFIGQFGIGLLSCFMVSDEIVMITRSAQGGPAIEWIGRFDGTFVTRTLEGDFEPGTRVFLKAKEGCEDYLRAKKVEELVRHYCDLLPCPIFLSDEAGAPRQVNRMHLPFGQKDATEEALMEYGQELFGQSFMAAIPLRTSGDKTLGAAYVLPYSPSSASKPAHRVYVNRMLLSGENRDILPDWAFFVRAVVNSSELRPTASRESLYQDAALEKVRKQMGRCIRDFLVKLHRENPSLLNQIIEQHRIPIKLLARDDDDFFRIIIHYLRFPTNFGQLTIREYREHSKVVYHLPDEQEFEQVRQVANYRKFALINSRFDFDQELILKLPQVFEGIEVVKVDPQFIMEQLETPSDADQDLFLPFLEQINQELKPFHCSAILRKFEPANVPALYHMDGSMEFARSTERMDKDVSSFWGSLLRAVSNDTGKATLCLNVSNPLVQQMARLDPQVLPPFIRLLYIQALLMGNNQITPAELNFLADGFGSLLQFHAQNNPPHPL